MITLNSSQDAATRNSLAFLFPLILHTAPICVQCDEQWTNIKENHFKFGEVIPTFNNSIKLDVFIQN